MLNRIKNKIVNDIRVLRQKVRDILTTVVDFVDAVVKKIKTFVLKLIDIAKYFINDKEKRNNLFSSVGEFTVEMIAAFFVSNKEFIPFFNEWLAEGYSSVILCGIALRWTYQIIKFLLCLSYLSIRKYQTRNLADNNPNKVKITYKSLGENLGFICYTIFESRNVTVTP